jgi:DNA-binding NtrC family response regulator
MGRITELRRLDEPLVAEPPRILVVEDALTTREMLSRYLMSRGYRVGVVSAGEAVRCLPRSRADAVIVNLVGTSGLDLMTRIRTMDPHVPLLVVSDLRPPHTSTGPGEDAVAFLIRPFEERELDERLKAVLGEWHGIDEPPDRPGSGVPTLLGESNAMIAVRHLIERVADADVTVLIHGESGTGKEVTARALRHASLRSDKPFVKVNCAALPNDLLESELFGHERGAFTGAVQAKPGKFELADRGTVFLDEIGEMSPLLQAKLLQVLQDGEFSRLGGASDVKVDVRVVAATNRDLKRAVADGQFREDLFFRLNVVSITLPPLRAHKEDIPQLTAHFLREQSLRFRNRPSVRPSPETERLFVQYDWPGNVRELENAVKRMIVLGSDVPVREELRAACRAASPVAAGTEADPPAPLTGSHPMSLKEIGRTAAREAERVAILDMLERTRWNRKEAAEILGISYKALLYKIKDNHLDQA